MEALNQVTPQYDLIIINPDWKHAEYFSFSSGDERQGFVDGVLFICTANLVFLAPEEQSLAEYNQEHNTDWTIGLNDGPLFCGG
tara:strand:+ start:178 stop:429 length:252 start_codon:yes stop_codon:yes gene_type:complete